MLLMKMLRLSWHSEILPSELRLVSRKVGSISFSDSTACVMVVLIGRKGLIIIYFSMKIDETIEVVSRFRPFRTVFFQVSRRDRWKQKQ